MLFRKKFGEIAIEKKLITREILEKALLIQKNLLDADKEYKKIGVILHEMGAIEHEDLEMILQEQEGFFLWKWIYSIFSKDAK